MGRIDLPALSKRAPGISATGQWEIDRVTFAAQNVELLLGDGFFDRKFPDFRIIADLGIFERTCDSNVGGATTALYHVLESLI